MSNRAVAPLLAVLISSLASAVLTASAIAAPAESQAEAPANDCLTAPKGETPKGSHWYYRLEKGTKRKCWYLADQVAKTSKVASATPAPAPSASPSPPRAPEAAIQSSVANARAELTTRSQKTENASDDARLSETIWPEPEQRADAAADTSDQGTNVQLGTIGTGAVATPSKDWAMTSRWPDANLPNTTNSQPAEQAETRPQQSAALQTVSAKDKPAAPVTAGQFHGISFDSTSMLLIMLAGVLTIVAVVGRMVTKYAGSGRAKNRTPRRNIWDAVPQDGDASHAYEALLQPRNSQFTGTPAEANNDPSNEIERLLQRASKHAAA